MDVPARLRVYLITGSTGFVGKALCAELDRRRIPFTAALRKSDAALRYPTVAVGDIGPLTSWHGALHGISAVLHLAGIAHRFGAEAEDLELFRRVNAEGTEHLAREAAAAGVRRFVFLSTVKVSGETSNARSIREDDEPRPVGAYAESKWLAEQALRRVEKETAMEVVIVRTPLVYGPGVKANFLALMRLVDRALPLPLGALRNARSLIYVENLVHALLLCAAHPAAAGSTFFVKDGADLSTASLARELANALGRPSRLFPVPPALLAAGATLLGRRDAIARLTESLTVDDTAIRERLGWTPPVDFSNALARTAYWYRHERT